VIRTVPRLTGGLTLAGLLLTLTACQTTQSSVTDAGCTIWREYGVKPSRADTAETIDGLVRLNRGMGAACD
jgi:hypothetical protein